MLTTTQVAEYLKLSVDFSRFSRLVTAVGDQLNDAQFRFLKAVIFESSLEVYSTGGVKYVAREGCDLVIKDPNFNNGVEVTVEVKFVSDALFTLAKKKAKEKIAVKLLNSNGGNTHTVLPDTYADYLLVVGAFGAGLVDKQTVSGYISPDGDGIKVDMPASLVTVLAGPSVMTGGNTEVDFRGPLMESIKSFINNIQ